MYKQLDTCLDQKNKFLEDKVEKLSQIFNHAPVAICVINIYGKIHFLNESCSRLLGYKKEQITGSNIKDYFQLNTFLDKRMDKFLGIRKRLESYPCIINNPQGGEAKYVELSVSPVSSQKLTDFVCVMVDVTNKTHADAKVLRSNKQMAKLKNISDLVNESLDLSQTLKSVLNEVLSCTMFNAGVIAIIDHFGRKLNPVAFQGLRQQDIITLEQSAPGPKYVEWLSGVSKPLVSVNASTDPLLKKCTFAQFGYPIIVSIPLRARNKTWGSLNIFSSEIRKLSDEDMEMLMAFGQQISIAIENSHLYKAELEKRKMLQSLIEVSTQLCGSLKLESVLNNIIELLSRLISFDSAVIIQVSENAIKIVSARGEVTDINKLAGYFIDSKIPNIIEKAGDLIEDDLVKVKNEKDTKIKSFLCNPLLSRGKILGAVIIGKDEPRFYSEADRQILSAFANFVATAIENAKLYEQTESELELRKELFKEMHHRIRNNLEMLLSLLQMEYNRYSEEISIRDSLHSVIERIESVSLLHTLFSLDSVNYIEADKLVGVCIEFATKIARGLGKNLLINYDANTADLKLPSKKALTTALVLNELLTNAIHHAFDDRKHGIITVNLKKQDNQICLLVNDNGKGFPPSFNLNESSGLGLKIVKNLINKELKGSINISISENTKIEVSYLL